MSPTKQAGGDSGKEQKIIGDKMEKKPWEKPGSVGGQFPSGQTNQQFVPTAAKSDCKGSTGSSGLFLMAV